MKSLWQCEPTRSSASLTRLEDRLAFGEVLALDGAREQREVALLVVFALEQRHRVEELVQHLHVLQLPAFAIFEEYFDHSLGTADQNALCSPLETRFLSPPQSFLPFIA